MFNNSGVSWKPANRQQGCEVDTDRCHYYINLGLGRQLAGFMILIPNSLAAIQPRHVTPQPGAAGTGECASNHSGSANQLLSYLGLLV